MSRVIVLCGVFHYDESMETKQRNHTIDVLKLIFSICIIGIHLNLFKDSSTPAYWIITQSLFRVGVPFYFITSGYYFASKLHDDTRSNAWLMRLLKIYLVFEAIDIGLNLAVGNRLPIGIILLRVCTTGMNRIYWYLVSLLVTCALCRPLWKRGHTGILIGIGFLLYLLTMTYDSYSWLFAGTVFEQIGAWHTSIWSWPQAGFGESVLFLSLGIWLHQKRIQSAHAGMILLCSMVFLLMEGWLCQSQGAADANCYLSLIPVSICLFLWTLDHPHICRIPHAGDMSLYVYMIHTYFNYVSYIAPVSPLRFLLSASLSLLASALIVRIHTGWKKSKNII